jgi:5-(carboxyamino)imidazole ribonucleotide mutase
MTSISVIMGSQSDWDTMTHCCQLLDQFAVAYEKHVISAHRTPLALSDFAAKASERGLQIIIAGAGGAAHLPGMVASQTLLPVIGVPIQSRILNGIDSLLSIVQMPAGIPVATMAIGHAGARNAAFMAISILALQDATIRLKLEQYRAQQTQAVLENQSL